MMRLMQEKIIQVLRVLPTIDPAVEVRRRIDFLKEFLVRSRLDCLVLGVSGGQDSSLAGRLSQLAVEELRKESDGNNYQFIAVHLPYGKQTDEKDVAMAVNNFIHPDQIIRINIKKSTDMMVMALKKADVQITDFNKGNIKARERMVVQYAIASKNNGAVVGTGHAAEAVTGFYTKYGDGGVDVAPLSQLDKRQGRQILKYLDAPAVLYEKIPTADLEEDRPNFPDEAALGVSYEEIDNYLEGKSVSDAVASKIENWYKRSFHKRNLPVTPGDSW